MSHKAIIILVFIIAIVFSACTEEQQGVEFAIKEYTGMVKYKGNFIEPNVRYQYVPFGDSKKIDVKFCKENFNIPAWIPDPYISNRYKNDTIYFGDDTAKSKNGKIVLDTINNYEDGKYYYGRASTKLIYDNNGRLIRYERFSNSSDEKSPNALRIEYDATGRVKTIIEETLLYGDISNIIEYDEKGDINLITKRTKKQTILELERSK